MVMSSADSRAARSPLLMSTRGPRGRLAAQRRLEPVIEMESVPGLPVPDHGHERHPRRSWWRSPDRRTVVSGGRRRAARGAGLATAPARRDRGWRGRWRWRSRDRRWTSVGAGRPGRRRAMLIGAGSRAAPTGPAGAGTTTACWKLSVRRRRCERSASDGAAPMGEADGRTAARRRSGRWPGSRRCPSSEQEHEPE